MDHGELGCPSTTRSWDTPLTTSSSSIPRTFWFPKIRATSWTIRKGITP